MPFRDLGFNFTYYYFINSLVCSQTRAESIMAQADHAVEAMPKRAKTYNDEIDAIELPEEMKAKKTNNIAEIPGLPEF